MIEIVPELPELKTLIVDWAWKLHHSREEIKIRGNDVDVVMRRGVKKVNYHLLEMENSLADDIREEEAVGRLDELRSGRAPAPVPVPFSIWFPTQCLVLLLEPRLNPDRTLQGSFLGWRFQQDFLYTHSNSTSLVKGGIVPSLHHQLVLSTICNVASSSTWSVGNDSSVWEGREATTSFQEVVTDPGMLWMMELCSRCHR